LATPTTQQLHKFSPACNPLSFYKQNPPFCGQQQQQEVEKRARKACIDSGGHYALLEVEGALEQEGITLGSSKPPRGRRENAHHVLRVVLELLGGKRLGLFVETVSAFALTE